MGLRTPVALLALVLTACQAPAANDSSQPATQSAQASPTAIRSATAMASPPGSPSATATPTPVVSSAFPPGSLARVAVDTLVLREEPGTSAKAVARIPGGDIVYLLGPPFEREDDGYVWRYVRYLPDDDASLVLPPAGVEVAFGWVAIGEGTTPFLTPEPAICPAEPITVDVLAETLPFALVECFGRREITVKGTVITGFGGYIVGEFEPSWLAHPNSFAGAISTATHPFFYSMPSGPTHFVDGQRIQITGHYDDPAAAECHMAPGNPPVAEPNSLARMACQSRFVATEIKAL
jgi:hypothetical protein